MDCNPAINNNYNYNDNCNPVDLSVIINSNLLKNSNWNNNRLQGGSASLRDDNRLFGKTTYDVGAQDYNITTESNNNRFFHKVNDMKDDEIINSTVMASNFHDENRNIKVE